MKRLNFVTLGVENLKASTEFYQKLFDWELSEGSNDHITFFNMGGYILALFPREELAKDVTVSLTQSGYSPMTLAHNVREKSEVATFLNKAESCGARIIKPAQDVFWGGHGGYFADPNDHLWEVAFNPFIPTKDDGFLDL